MSTTDESELSIYSRIKGKYRKYYIPLESDPDIFTELVRNLGVDGYEVQDVVSLDPEMLAFVPRPVVALIFTCPCSVTFDKEVEEREKDMKVYQGKGEDEPIVWLAQTIQNACGLYALLHALANGIDRLKIRKGSPLDEYLTEAIPLAPEERALALEASKAIEAAHAAAAVKGISRVPEADEQIDYHYICFAKSKDGHIYELNGCSKGPVDTGVGLAEGEDLLSEPALGIVRHFIGREAGNVGFNLLGLVPVS